MFLHRRPPQALESTPPLDPLHQPPQATSIARPMGRAMGNIAHRGLAARDLGGLVLGTSSCGAQAPSHAVVPKGGGLGPSPRKARPTGDVPAPPQVHRVPPGGGMRGPWGGQVRGHKLASPGVPPRGACLGPTAPLRIRRPPSEVAPPMSRAPPTFAATLPLARLRGRGAISTSPPSGSLPRSPALSAPPGASRRGTGRRGVGVGARECPRRGAWEAPARSAGGGLKPAMLVRPPLAPRVAGGHLIFSGRPTPHRSPAVGEGPLWGPASAQGGAPTGPQRATPAGAAPGGCPREVLLPPRSGGTRRLAALQVYVNG